MRSRGIGSRGIGRRVDSALGSKPISLQLKARYALVAMVIALAGCLQTLSLVEQIAALMREAQQFFAAKQYDQAIGKYAQAVKLDVKHWPAYLGLARSYIGKGNWSEAINNGKQAYQLSPNGTDVIAALAESLLGGGLAAVQSGQYNQAIGYLGDYIKLQPNNATAYLNMGKAFLGSGQFAPALDSFVKGLGVAGAGGERSELVRSMFDGGMQAFGKSDYRGAIGFFREYLKTDRNNLQAYLNLGKSLWNVGDRGEAINAFREVLQISPSNAEALRFMLQR